MSKLTDMIARFEERDRKSENAELNLAWGVAAVEAKRLLPEWEAMEKELADLRPNRCTPDRCANGLACMGAENPQPGELASARARIERLRGDCDGLRDENERLTTRVHQLEAVAEAGTGLRTNDCNCETCQGIARVKDAIAKAGLAGK